MGKKQTNSNLSGRTVHKRADENQSSALKICIAVSKEKVFLQQRKNHGKKTVQGFEIRANMWSTENSRFCEKYIEKQPKTSQNGLFSAVFWSK